MEAHWYKPRECYRVWVPARLSENGKRCRRFFETKAEAEKFILQAKRRGSVQLADLSIERCISWVLFGSPRIMSQIYS